MEKRLIGYGVEAIKQLYDKSVKENIIQVQTTRKEFEGEYTLVVFPLLRFSGKSPEITASEIGDFFVKNYSEIQDYNVVKGFLNLKLSSIIFIEIINNLASGGAALQLQKDDSQPVLIEYSSPNTNKPLHLGHIRNNLLGFSISRILEACGKNVIKTNIVNDRGIHICKSMLAWKLYGEGETPEKTGEKGDHLVGKYYVRFDKEYKLQQAELIEKGMSTAEAADQAELMKEARQMLRDWEEGKAEVVALWKTMNDWVYKGFDITYKALGVDFDKIYKESDTYRIGKQIVLEALEKGVLEKKADGSIWADFSEEGLDQKLLLRADGTAVYMTQDLGTAVERYNDFKFEKHYYVVGNEQNYHFQVLSLLLKKLGYSWSEALYHFSYGMVELPEGKMKSREGTVVDADDLIAGMIETAKETSEELGKLGDYSEKEKSDIYRKVGLGALKYYILKVDPKKNMMFNPAESIDFNGNTGPFIQYTNARINSVLRKADTIKNVAAPTLDTNSREQTLIISLSKYKLLVKEAADTLSPSMIANYSYDLARDFNQFYHDFSILKEENIELRNLRLILCRLCGEVLEHGMGLLGIEMPERM